MIGARGFQNEGIVGTDGRRSTMGVIGDVRRTAATLLALTGFPVAALGGSVSARSAHEDWLMP